MAITTKAGLQAALEAPQMVLFTKANATPGQFNWGSLFNIGSNPAAGTLAGASTAAGVVPDDSTAGCPTITDFVGGNTGYLGGVAFSTFTNGTMGGCRLRLSDLLFKAGAYSFNSNVSLSAQPSYSARIPGADYKGTEIWIETVTAFTGIPAFTITYTNQSGVGAQTTGSVSAPAALAANRMMQVPLAAGDNGVQKIESVLCGTATVGTFNVLVLRPLWMGNLANSGYDAQHGPDLTDLPIVYGNSALYLQQACEMTSNNTLSCEIALSIING